MTLFCPPGSDEHRVFSDPGSTPRLCPTSQKVKSGVGVVGVRGRYRFSRGGILVRPFPTRWHSRAISAPKTAQTCRLSSTPRPKTHAIDASTRPATSTPFGFVGWRLPDPEEFSVVRWGFNPHLTEVNGAKSGNRHPIWGFGGASAEQNDKSLIRRSAPTCESLGSGLQRSAPSANPPAEALHDRPCRVLSRTVTLRQPSTTPDTPSPPESPHNHPAVSSTGTRRQGDVRGIGSWCQGHPTCRDERTSCGVSFKIR